MMMMMMITFVLKFEYYLTCIQQHAKLACFNYCYYKKQSRACNSRGSLIFIIIPAKNIISCHVPAQNQTFFIQQRTCRMQHHHHDGLSYETRLRIIYIYIYISDRTKISHPNHSLACFFIAIISYHRLWRGSEALGTLLLLGKNTCRCFR